MKNITILICLLIIKVNLFAETGFVKVRLHNSNSTYSELIKDLDLESALIKNGEWVEVIVNSTELEKIKSAKLNFELLVLNNKPTENENNKDLTNSLQSAKYFKYGKLGGFYTLSEAVATYDSLMSKFPDLIEKISIGKSVQNRDIWSYKLHDKLNSKDTVSTLMTALHHAREPLGLTTLTYFVCELLEKYEQGDFAAKHLLSNLQIFIVPVINPDSYLANQTGDSTGGGMIRKNQRYNNSGKYIGTDLNRNYGPYSMWDATIGGSSILETDETYRGTAPFSEPETMAIRNLALQHNFKTAINYHSYGDMVIHPWNAYQINSDSSLYQSYCLNSTELNRYIYGWDVRSVGYFARGNSDEWFYSTDLNKKRTLSVTPEIGKTKNGFWGYTRADILRYGIDNLAMNYNVLWSANDNVVVYSSEYNCEKNEIKVKLRNIGTEKSKNTNLVINADNSFLNIDKEFLIFSLEKNQDTILTLPISYLTGFENATKVNLSLVYLKEGKIYRSQAFAIALGNCKNNYLFRNNEISSDWLSNTWGLELDLQTKTLVLNDSPYTTYKDSAKTYLTYDKSITLSSDTVYNFVFDTRWNIEREFDFATIEIFSSKSNSWKSLTTSRTVAGSNAYKSAQPTGSIGLHGNINEWIRQSCVLEDYSGANVKFRFGVVSDGGNHFEGFYLKDIRIEKFAKKLLTDVLEEQKNNTTYYFIANDRINFNEPQNVEIVNLLGAKVKTFENTKEIDLSPLESNVYFLILNNSNEQTVIKYIKY